MADTWQGREDVAAYLDEWVVDSTSATLMLGLSGRQSLHYYVATGHLVPLTRLAGGLVFWRPDVEGLAARVRRG